MTEMFKISLPDGSVREVAPGTTPADIAAAIGPGLAKAALAARVDWVPLSGSDWNERVAAETGCARARLATAKDAKSVFVLISLLRLRIVARPWTHGGY